MSAGPSRPSGDQVGVQVVLLNPAGEVLLQLRDDDPAIPYPGTWCLPGGHLEGAELPVDCAVRELREEMGLHLAAARLRHVKSQQRSYGYEHTWWAAVDVDPATIELTEGQAVRFFSRGQVAGMRLGYEDDDVLADFFAEHPDGCWGTGRPPAQGGRPATAGC